MDFDFETPIDRHGSGSLKWDLYGRNVLPLWIADMDFRAPPAVIDALHRRVDHGVFGYTHAPDALVGIIVERLHVRYEWEIDPAWIVWLPGLVSGLNVACRAIGTDGDAIVTLTPVYPPFLEAPALHRRELVEVPLTQDAQRCWIIDFARLKAAIRPHTSMLLLCNPHNPVGRAYTREELTQLAAIAESHNLVICSDEIHCDLVLDADKRHVPTASIDASVAARTITLMAPSKTFNLPGLGCGFAIIPDAALRERYQRAMSGIVPYVNALGYTAALAAYRDSGAWHSALIDYLRANRGRVVAAVAGISGLQVNHIEATYLAWIDARELDVADPAVLFQTAGVALSDGAEFGAPGFLRLNFGTSRATLDEAFDRMRAAVGNPS